MTDSVDGEDLRSIAQQWGLATHTALDVDALLEVLAHKVAEMLRTDRRKFMNALYRLDVSEERVGLVMCTAPAAEQPRRIAELILKRELQKAATRRQAENKS